MTAWLAHPRATLFRKHIALPQQHGAWVMLLGPFAVGLGVAGRLTPAHAWLSLALLSGFLVLQPLTLLTKRLAGRRSRDALAPILFWLGLYGLGMLVGGLGLVALGQGWVAALGALGLPVVAWQLTLVARRQERGALGVELVGAGVLALAAPAAYGVGVGAPTPTALWLWLLCWLQQAAAIVYIYACLVYRRLPAVPAWPTRRQIARRSLLYHVANVALVGVGAALGWLPAGVVVAFALALAEAVWGGLLRPPIGVRPVRIGLRQVALTVVFSVALTLAYRL